MGTWRVANNMGWVQQMAPAPTLGSVRLFVANRHIMVGVRPPKANRALHRCDIHCFFFFRRAPRL